MHIMNNIKYVEYFLFYMCTRFPQKFDLDSTSSINNTEQCGGLYRGCETGRSMPRER
jgi:hypothetical protein